MNLSATNYQTVRTECSLAKRNSSHVLVSAAIRRLLDTCLSGIHNANNIVNSIVCAVILVRGSRVPAYGIRPMHGSIHVLDMHGTGTKHIVRHSQKSSVLWSGVAEFTCIKEPVASLASLRNVMYLSSLTECRDSLRINDYDAGFPNWSLQV